MMKYMYYSLTGIFLGASLLNGAEKIQPEKTQPAARIATKTPIHSMSELVEFIEQQKPAATSHFATSSTTNRVYGGSPSTKRLGKMTRNRHGKMRSGAQGNDESEKNS